MSATERVRQLRFRAPVAVLIQDRAAMRAYVEQALDDTELTRARRRYLALGLLDPQLDVRELISALMEEELIGYYDPDRKRLAIRDDVARGLSASTNEPRHLEWQATVVHELVHALQDQHLDLSAAMVRERTTDQENAFGALVEGDATLAMLGYMAERSGGTLDGLVADRDGLGASLRVNPIAARGRLAEAPAIVREPLLFRYREGALYAAHVYAANGWSGVNRAHRASPLSTFSVSFPALQAEQVGPLRFPELTRLSKYGCTETERDVLGSVELSAALQSPGLQSNELARSWRGDSYAVLACGPHAASLWLIQFATPSLARRARGALGGLPSFGLARIVLQLGALLVVARGVPAALVDELTQQLSATASRP